VVSSAADQRAGDAADGEDAGEQPLVAPALPRRDQIADDGLGQGHQPPGAEPLQGPEADELQHGAGQAAQDRGQKEDADGDHHHAPPPVHVRQLAVERGGDGGGQQEGGDNPGQVRHPAEIGGDAGQRGVDHVLVHRREPHDQHEADEHDAQLSLKRGGGAEVQFVCAAHRSVSGMAAHRAPSRRRRPSNDKMCPVGARCTPWRAART
jgi:hypothetical protein